MGGVVVTGAMVDFADVQGLVRFGYRRMTDARYELLRIRNAEAARSWLRSAPITTAVTLSPPPKAALQVAFTASGLKALGVAESVIAAFSHEFRAGMAERSRARQLGDVGDNAPSGWDWGHGASEPHLVVMFFAEPGHLDALIGRCCQDAWGEAFERVRRLDTSNLDGIEPFGFADGASQPQIDWEERRETPCVQWDYSNLVALGEFLLGYRNEYGKITDRPLLKDDASTAQLLPALDAATLKDLGRNGTYLVMRQLDQDVRGFWQFLGRRAGGSFVEAETIATAMVGRTRAGEPLMSIQDHAIPGIGPDPEQIRQNQFTFDRDPSGARCPFGAHIRRANPRSTDYPGRPTGIAKLMTMLGFGPSGFRDDLISSVRFHRILRRGREYGSELAPEEAMKSGPDGEAARGLHFICLNANIGRQFEFVQNAWISNTKFAAMSGESDPLLGNRAPLVGCPRTDEFSMPVEGGMRRRITGLPPFVRLRGGAYFFLPSIRALRYFAGVTGPTS